VVAISSLHGGVQDVSGDHGSVLREASADDDLIDSVTAFSPCPSARMIGIFPLIAMHVPKYVYPGHAGVRGHELRIEVGSGFYMLNRGRPQVRMTVDTGGCGIHVTGEYNVVSLFLEPEGLVQHVLVKAEFMIMPGSVRLAGDWISIRTGSPVDLVAVDHGKSKMELVNQDSAFKVPIRLAGGLNSGGKVVSDQSSNSMYFSTEAGGVILVLWQRELRAVSGLIREVPFVGSMLQLTLGGRVFETDLDLLETQQRRPVMTFQKSAQWSDLLLRWSDVVPAEDSNLVCARSRGEHVFP